MDEIRLDKYLWAVRIFKTRSDAADAVRNNKVTVNGSYAKPSREVKLGDVIAVRKQQVTYSYKVLDLVSCRFTASISRRRRSWQSSTCRARRSSSSVTAGRVVPRRRSAANWIRSWTGSVTTTDPAGACTSACPVPEPPCAARHGTFFLCAAGTYSRSRRAGGMCRSGSRRPGCGSGLRRCRRGLRPARGPAGGRRRPGRYPQRPHICSETLRFAHSSA